MNGTLQQFTVAEPRQLEWASVEQGQAFEYGPYPMCMSGGWGSGKTWAACLKAIWLSTVYKRNRGVIARHVGRDLRDTTMATFYKVCPPALYDQSRGGRRNDQNGYLRFADSQSEVLFIHLDDPETAGLIRGLEANWFIIDQAEENPEHMEELFDMLCGRLGRWDVAEVPQFLIDDAVKRFGAWPYLHPETHKPTPPPYPMLCCNPDVETHWIYRRFHPDSAEHHERYAPLGYRMFHMPTESSRFVSEVNLKFLLERDEAFVRRNVKGLWGQPEGAIHVIHPSSLLEGDPELVDFLRRTCSLGRTLDHGDSAPTSCLWWAVDRNGNVFNFMEYYQPNKTISTHRGNIAGLSHPGDRYDTNYADPSIFYTLPAKQGGRFCVADEYSETVGQPAHTALHWAPADNNELGTRNRINEYLRFDPEHIHPVTKAKGAARLFFVKRSDDWPNGIVHALRETRAQRRVKIGTDLGRPIFSDERDPDIPDHAYDCVRYEIASRPPVAPVLADIAPGTFMNARRLIERHRRGIRRRKHL